MTSAASLDPHLQDHGFRLVDETADFLIIHKAPGISFHREEETPGLFDRVKQSRTNAVLYPVHRLDKVTSGLLVLAKTQHSARIFGELFASKKVDKYYLALAQGKPRKKQGTIKGDMVKARRGAWKLNRSLENPAITHFRSFGTASGIRVFLVKPATGKTHQIRVALKSLGTPVLGDELYGESSACDRVYLHAFGLSFEFEGTHYRYFEPPLTGELFTSPEVDAVIKDQLIPPWQVSFPMEK